MAVKIRLMRVGKKKQPTYRVVVADGRSPRDGRFIEIIGQYAPRQEPSGVEINAESALAWLRKGAQPTEQVQKLLTVTGVWAQYEAERGKPAVTKLSRPRVHDRQSGSRRQDGEGSSRRRPKEPRRRPKLRPSWPPWKRKQRRSLSPKRPRSPKRRPRSTTPAEDESAEDAE